MSCCPSEKKKKTSYLQTRRMGDTIQDGWNNEEGFTMTGEDSNKTEELKEDLCIRAGSITRARSNKLQ